jgi:hypothetical protein
MSELRGKSSRPDRGMVAVRRDGIELIVSWAVGEPVTIALGVPDDVIAEEPSYTLDLLEHEAAYLSGVLGVAAGMHRLG